MPVIVHPDARAILAEHYGDKLTDARLRMARTPEGASLIENPRTKAPGIRVENIFIMAGVPMITQGMLAALDGQLPGGAPVLSRTVAAWTQESTVAATLGAVEKAHPGRADRQLSVLARGQDRRQFRHPRHRYGTAR